MSVVWIFSILVFFIICFLGYLEGLEKQFSIYSVNASRTRVTDSERFHITVFNTSTCNSLQDLVSDKVVAKCDYISSCLGMCSYQCRCQEKTSSILVSDMKCIDERNFREGKSFPRSYYCYIITMGDCQ